MEKQLTTKRPSGRPSRRSLAKRSRLDVKNRDPNYVYRIVNANLERDPERVQDFIDLGYEIVPRQETGQVGDKRVDDPSALGSAGQISVGQGTKAVVMRIPREWYEEDQKTKQDEINRVESQQKNKADYGSLDIQVKRTPE